MRRGEGSDGAENKSGLRVAQMWNGIKLGLPVYMCNSTDSGGQLQAGGQC